MTTLSSQEIPAKASYFQILGYEANLVRGQCSYIHFILTYPNIFVCTISRLSTERNFEFIK